jgi:hypothetical protein
MTNSNQYSLQQARKKRGESYANAVRRVMNNFYMYFSPDGVYRRELRGQCWNITWIAYLLQDKDAEGLTQPYSHKRLHQTGEEFIAEMDRTVEELGKSKDITEAIRRFYSKESDREQLYKGLWDSLLPVYIALRKKGYSARDLVT